MANNNDIYSFGDTTNINQILNDLISSDMISKNKMFMKKAECYYNAHNDVEYIDFRKYTANGITKYNENRSNRKVSHNFFKILVNQTVSYIVGNPITYQIDDVKLQQYLDQKFMFEFDDNNVMWIKEANKKGVGYVHVYYDKEGELQYCVIPSEQIIPIYEDSFKKKLKEVVRYYKVQGVNSKGEKEQQTRVEWWTAETVTYYREIEKGQFIQESDCMSHWTYSIDTNPEYLEGLSWGKVPFIQLFNNDEATSQLVDIKESIDAYDLIQSEFVNQIADVREILIKVLGYSGTSADEILQAFRGTGIVKIDDPTGNIDVLKTDIPVEARQTALKNLKDNIFLLGQGVDTNPEKLGTNSSGIALKMLYGHLDLKANTLIRKLKKSLYEFMWFIIEDYNRKFNTSIDFRDIKLTVNKNMIVNESEIIENIVKSNGLISRDTQLEMHPYVEDPTREAERLDEEEQANLENYMQQVENNNTINEQNKEEQQQLQDGKK